MTPLEELHALEPLMEKLGWWVECYLCRSEVVKWRGRYMYMSERKAWARAHIDDFHALCIVRGVAERELHKTRHHSTRCTVENLRAAINDKQENDNDH